MNNKINCQNQDYQRLRKYKEIWQKKKLIRSIYNDWYRKINKDLKPGKTLEIGSGTGTFKKLNSSITSSDIVPCEWLDKCIDAHNIPYKNNSLSNIVMIDVLHHLQNPVKFLHQAHRVLNRNGRVLMIEPFPSPTSLIACKIFHPEPFIFNADLFSKNKLTKKSQPWDSNQAIPYLLFYKHLNKFNRLFKTKFKIIKKYKFSFFLYPLSGGFEHKQLIPNFLFPLSNLFEKLLTPFKDLLAFRCYLILEKLN